MEKIKRFFECYIPVTACNFKCEYCYIRQEHRVLGEMPEWQYSPEYIGEALNKERLGGYAILVYVPVAKLCCIQICRA